MADKSDDGGDRPIRDMSFKMPEEFHYQYKLAAHNADLTMKELLVEAFDLWRIFNDK